MNDSKPTRARYIVLVFLCTLMFVLYLDRNCISMAVVPIQKELDLSNRQMGFVLAAFTIAYGLFEVPTGHWGDRIGPRAVLTRIALWWSVFTALTGSCTGFVSLLLVRFLFGAGEAGALPNSARVVSRWFPAPEQGRISGILQTFMLVGGIAAQAVSGFLMPRLGWRWVFVLYGSVGLVWAAAFWSWFRNDPSAHPAVNLGERNLIGEGGPAGGTHGESIPWKAVLRNPSLWTLGGIMVFSAFNTYVYYSWFPKYLEAARGATTEEAGVLSSMVQCGGAIGTLLGGFLADFVARRADRNRARRVVCSGCYVLSAACLGLALQFQAAWLTALFAGLSCLALASSLSIWWACVFEVSGRHLGALFGMVNGMGVFGAAGSQLFFGAFADWRGAQGYSGREQWDPAFLVVVGGLLLAALLWSQYRCQPVEPAAASETRDTP